MLRRKIGVFLLSGMLIACANTTKILRKYEPGEYIRIKGDIIKIEKRLRGSDLDYYCADIYASTRNDERACFVEKTLVQELREVQEVLMQTPKAIALDTGKNLLVVGDVALNVLLIICTHGGTGTGTSICSP